MTNSDQIWLLIAKLQTCINFENAFEANILLPLLSFLKNCRHMVYDTHITNRFSQKKRHSIFEAWWNVLELLKYFNTIALKINFWKWYTYFPFIKLLNWSLVRKIKLCEWVFFFINFTFKFAETLREYGLSSQFISLKSTVNV